MKGNVLIVLLDVKFAQTLKHVQNAVVIFSYKMMEHVVKIVQTIKSKNMIHSSKLTTVLIAKLRIVQNAVRMIHKLAKLAKIIFT